MIKGSGMKYTLKFIVITVLFMLIFYRVDSTPAMAAEENTESFAGPQTSGDSADFREEETEETGEPAALPEEEAEGTGASADLLEAEPEDIQVAMIRKESEDTVSTGPELMEWLDSHKNTGGTVRLLDHIVLDQDYSFFPNGSNMPAVYVDTDRYTITVTAEVELSSDSQLTFSGEPEGKGIFCVAKKGMLSILGIAVESQQCALWQEEGGGLVVSSCHVSGDVHYADTPYVMYWKEDLCAVVEKGQTVNEVLPSQISCTVNCQGRLCYGEPIPVLWNLEGSEKQQEERLRFQAQGFFQQAVSLEPVRCTVVYNDYPMTFEEVHASVYGNCYMFKGYYTKPEEESPYTLKSEYSYDAENWLVSDEMTVDNTYAGFVIVVDDVQSDRAAHPYIYIRLQYNNNGTRYFSNVLCYAADNLDVVEDIGGSRGGGTSITNPPDEPQEEIVDPPSEEEKPEPEPDRDNGPDKDDPKTADAGRAEKETRSDAGGENDNAGLPTYAVPEEGNAGQRSESAPLNLNKKADQPSDAKAGSADAQQMPQDESPEPGEAPALYAKTDAGDGESAVRRDPAVPDRREAVEVISAYGGNGVDLTQAQTLRGDNRRGGHMVIAAGVVLLSAAAGAAGFYARSRYSRSGTKR